ncbi:MAG: DEAD/DEAH box helicase [Bacteroidota bacterium]|nr:DEAD/DEAH box helicase [Bacteroidota bacterium]MDP4233381.1 DEAD/DEAH box helicase [Bacteroidota bacterium]MDP4242247.1 DEAD/DEAH box helicase [Bacteroidota bacterium]MDP4287003.1 DEAD/DEAH box helicase [Bacteroidota bacterium]
MKNSLSQPHNTAHITAEVAIEQNPFFDLGLIPEICERVAKIGYTTPTPVQREAIPLVLEGHDVIGIAQTGTGKTAAFMLPLIDSLICSGIVGESEPAKPKSAPARPSGRPASGRQGARAAAPRSPARTPRVLVLEPTRELAVQVHEATVSFAQGSGLRAVVIYGGVGQRPQEREFERGCDILIATPGRLNDLLGQRIVSLSGIEFLVLDEADRMLDMGFLPQIKRITAQVPRDRQTLMFSATLSHEIEELERRLTNDPTLVEVGGRRKPAEGVTQQIYSVMRLKKPELLLKLLQDMQRDASATEKPLTLIFTRTKHDADRVAHVLDHAGVNVTKLHSDLTQADRTRALADFKSRRFDTLVATDVASRGLDIEDISHVINYEPPMSPDDYVHRVGRTARAEKTGIAITLVGPEEEPLMREIEKRIGMQIERTTIEGFAPPPPIEMSIAERRRLKGWSRR